MWSLPVQAQSASSWLTANPVLGQREETGSALQPETIAFAGNIPCSTTTFTLRPAIPPLQTSETAQACAVMTPQGKTAPGGFTNVFKADARLYNSGGGAVNYYPVPGDSSGVVLESTAQGTKLHYYSSGLLSSRKEFNPTTREMKAYMPASPSWTLKDASGKVVYVRPDSLAFSANGQWLVADSEFLATVRVNLATGEILPFSSPYAYHLGFSVMPNLAISDDGKTVVMTSDRGDFKMIDLSACGPVPSVITGPVSCSSASHETFLRSQIPGYYRIYQPRFLSDRRLGFYASYNNTPTTRVLARLRLAPAGEVLQNQDYLALGDSFTSGEGAYDYFPETDTDANKCHLSRQSYPYLIGQQLSLGSFNSVACSGAKIQDITSYAQKPKLPSPNSLGRLLPGHRKQLEYLREQNPNVITVGVGGNDAGITSRVKACLNIGTCYQSYEDRLEIVREINNQFPKLVDLYGQLRKESKSGAKIYVVGYPMVAKVNGQCAANVLLNNDEIVFTNQLIDYLNQVIELAAGKAGVRYVDVETAFDGHRLCETESLNTAFNGITLGDDIPFGFGPFGNESFHPNRLGHQQYRQKILAETSNFTQTLPVANNSLQPPAENSGLKILEAPKTNRVVNETIHDETISADTVTRDTTINLQASADKYFLQPGSDYKVEIRSQPISLGTFSASSSGGVSAVVTIPAGVPTGFHSLHILGQNLVGNTVDIYKAVYVAASAETTDGDGLTVSNQTRWSSTTGSVAGLPPNDSAPDEDPDSSGGIWQEAKDKLGVSQILKPQHYARRSQAGLIALLVFGFGLALYLYNRGRR